MREPKPPVVFKFEGNGCSNYDYPILEDRHTLEDFKRRFAEFLGLFIDDPDYERDVKGELRHAKKVTIEFNDPKDLQFLRSLIHKDPE